MNREQIRERVRARRTPWDMVVVGGGATGVGVAIDAASRGYETLLLERGDFGHGTSSRSTKLVHGGVRYLEQGNLSLVMEALKERGLLLRNAPHLVRNLAFVVPRYDWWEAPFYGLGLKVYDLLAGQYGFGASRILSLEETLDRLPTIERDRLRGGVIYFDGQFDDARLLIHMVATAFEQGATLLNHAGVTRLTKDRHGFIHGVTAVDAESGEEFQVEARVVINATGAFSDSVRRMAEEDAALIITPSQGIHLVLDRRFLRGDTAIMVPHTSDGRVLFAIPWHGHTLVGTTDTAVPEAVEEPVATEQEVEFVLSTAARYLADKPARADVLSVFAGIRPLAGGGEAGKTASVARDHVVRIENSGLVTICGGKWTTYRRMAEDCVNQAAVIAKLDQRTAVTETLKIHGACPGADAFGALSVYGSDVEAILRLANDEPGLSAPLDAELPYIGSEVIWAVRREWARTVEDVLARRTRALFLNVRAAVRMAPAVASLMAGELGESEVWAAGQVSAFERVAAHYRLG